MKIILATDHAGFETKECIKEYLTDEGYEVEDVGAYTFSPTDDYPKYMSKLAEKISTSGDENIFGIMFGGSGQGEAIVANRYKNIRAAVYPTKNLELITLAREHNNANVLSIGAFFLSEEDVKEAVDKFLNTSFNEDERHVRRIKEIDEIS